MINIIIPLCLLILFLCTYVYLHYFPSIPKGEKTFTYALLLGCPCHDDGTLCTSAKKRCELAISQYHQHRYRVLIITGGAVKNQYIESESMKDYLLKKETIPIITETKSQNTWENFLFSKAIIKNNSVLILTSSTHARRACAIARHFFNDYSAAWYPEHRIKHILREIVSRILYIKIEIQKNRKKKTSY